MMDQEQETDFDVEQRLRADTAGEYRAALRSRLGQMNNACTLASRQLQDRETYRRLKAAMAAVGAAEAVLDLMSRPGTGR